MLSRRHGVVKQVPGGSFTCASQVHVSDSFTIRTAAGSDIRTYKYLNQVSGHRHLYTFGGLLPLLLLLLPKFLYCCWYCCYFCYCLLRHRVLDDKNCCWFNESDCPFKHDLFLMYPWQYCCRLHGLDLPMLHPR